MRQRDTVSKVTKGWVSKMVDKTRNWNTILKIAALSLGKAW